MRAAGLSLVLCGCYDTFDAVGDGDVGDTGNLDAPRADTGDATIRDAGPPFDGGGAPAICGDTACAPGQICCRLDARCIEPGDPTCVVPVGETDPDACASNADCPRGQICTSARDGGITSSCAPGVGRCSVIPEGCFGSPQACGCDGRTYPNACAASALGVQVAWEVACGDALRSGRGQSCVGGPDPLNCSVHGHCDDATLQCVWDDVPIACGSDDRHCPAGQVCCRITGACHDPSIAGTCAPPPEGTLLPCASDDDCARWDGSWWGPAGIEGGSFCDGPGCSAPGGCRSTDMTCDGTLAPVCGCDGMTYQNACEAARARTGVANEGACE